MRAQCVGLDVLRGASELPISLDRRNAVWCLVRLRLIRPSDPQMAPLLLDLTAHRLNEATKVCVERSLCSLY